MRLRRIACMALVLALLFAALPLGGAYAAPAYNIVVDITNQYVTVYRTGDGSIVRQMICSTGRSSTPTPTGTYTMPAKRYGGERSEWYKIGGIYVKYASRIVGGILFHSYLFKARSDKSPDKTSIGKLGSQASHGCVRLRVADAKWIAQNCPAGTRVKIYKSGKKDSYTRSLLKDRTFSVDDGLTYGEYAGISTDPDIWGRNRKGEDVKELQLRLIGLGFLDGAADGTYGSATMAAVKAFQKAAGLAANGFADPDTRAAIRAEEAPTDTVATLFAGIDGPAVKYLQQSLGTLKLYSGEVDGVYNAELSQAVSLFQRLHGYAVNGKATGALQRDAAARAAALVEQFGDEEFDAAIIDSSVRMARVKPKSLNLRAAPSTGSKRLASLKKGTEVVVLSKGKTWTKVLYGVREGYLKNSYLTFFTKKTSKIEYALAGASGELPPEGNTPAPEPEILASAQPTEFLETAPAPEALENTPTPEILETAPTPEALENTPTPEALENAPAPEILENTPTPEILETAPAPEALENIPTPEILESAPTPELLENAPVQLAKVKTNGSKLNLRKTASTGGAIVARLANGTVLEVIEKGKTWTKVSYKGKEGYLKNSYLKFYMGAKPAAAEPTPATAPVETPTLTPVETPAPVGTPAPVDTPALEPVETLPPAPSETPAPEPVGEL